MNAIWVGTFTKGTDRRTVVSRISDQDWTAIQFLIRTICDSWAKQGWYLESYEMTGDLSDVIPQRDD